MVEAFTEYIYEHGYIWETFKFLDEGGRNSGKSTARSRTRYMLQFIEQHEVATLDIPKEARWYIGGNASFGYA
ncbi:hypothetical protein CXF72_13925 [Psychromonas sp. MB-3u-54]|uniref:hypothetical protein n=1 Tax=Psychromonas sp. MB-3u-54 TaxID=2058319 RepID=UPI000C33E7E9|nr:hypothetical protein [Psychromonas sp. MB-3u-54]PKH02022.1 hypothetical protein CXF72_13925 [Psychromonas sp. MB-3u-54]